MSMHVITNSSDKGQIDKAEDQELDRERDLEWILSSMRGRRWMYEIIHTKAHVRSGSHVAGCSDSTAYNEGGRSIGEAILEDIRMKHPKQFLKMYEENHFDG
jgi:hypothetical protein|tara:strand:+ start:153 stop:458 length:306 start_codon:yes stop_codon:yes gene_type:complete